ncbi:MAG: Rieske (2Fe-2S) protein [Planctomycetaceae bacterium]|nr:Rieske (2Fe-2S) protein [Planctomycetaceae bacterium]
MFVKVAKLGDIPAGEGRHYPVNGRMVAIFFVDGAYHAINDSCPHMGASLSAGYVEEGAVYCPWHAWRFSIHDGSWLDSPKSPLKCERYELRIEGDDILVEVPDPPPRQPSTPGDEGAG